MKKIYILITIVTLFLVPSIILAQGNQGGQGTQQQNRIQDPTTYSDDTTAQGNQVQNQNQVETQNQGEDSQMQINTQEQENYGKNQNEDIPQQQNNQGQGEGLQNRNQNALDNMSEVAKQVQLMQQIQLEGGLGEQVRQIAKEQNQSQNTVQEKVNKMTSRGNIKKFLIGPDYATIKSLKAELQQNQLRIKQLEQILTQLTNQEDITMVQSTIQAMINQNTALQEQINQQEQTRSLFGWLFRWFNK